jgi:hypothetical protein
VLRGQGERDPYGDASSGAVTASQTPLAPFERGDIGLELAHFASGDVDAILRDHHRAGFERREKPAQTGLFIGYVHGSLSYSKATGRILPAGLAALVAGEREASCALDRVKAALRS